MTADAQTECQGDERPGAWLFEQALRRVGAVDAIVADYATSICGRPVRRREIRPVGRGASGAGVTWSIDGDVVVTFVPATRGRSVVTVHEIALLQPLRKQLRSRRLLVQYQSR